VCAVELRCSVLGVVGKFRGATISKLRLNASLDSSQTQLLSQSPVRLLLLSDSLNCERFEHCEREFYLSITMSKKAVVPDAWEDDWEALADVRVLYQTFKALSGDI